jgi:hypothetical protein
MPAGKTGREITMNIRMAAVAACMLALGITPAAASLFTIETTFTATPNVVQVGETVILDLKITLIPDYAADAAANVQVFGTAEVWPGSLTVTDGVSVTPLRTISGGTTVLDLAPYPLRPLEYTFAVSYQTPGTYFPTFSSWGYISVEPIPFGSIEHYWIEPQGFTQVSVIPGPVVGAGLPGLVLAFGAGFAWWRRLKHFNRSVSS